MPQHHAKISYELTKDEVTKILIKALNLENNAKIEFKVEDTSDDRFGGGANHQMTKIIVSFNSTINSEAKI